MKELNVKTDIQELAVSGLKPFTDNPRDISGKALAGLEGSLERFGYVDLIVVNKRTMQVVSGNQRLKILQKRGIERVLCICVDMELQDQEMLAITLNNAQIQGYFTEAVTGLLERIRKDCPEEYINLRLQELREDLHDYEVETSGKTLPDDIPEPPAETITKSGDLWILGEHRLLCGDSTKENDVIRLMGGHKAQLLATDPPYLVDYTGADRPNGGKDWSNTYHEIDIKDGRKFMVDFLRIGLSNIDKNSAIYVWHASKRVVLIYEIFNELGILPHQPIIWVKPCGILTYAVYMWKHEPCILGWQKGSKPYYRPYQKSASSVWEIDLLKSGDPTKPEYYADIWRLDYDGKQRNIGALHPTVKPTEVFAIPMRMHTMPGDICYEPFSGSGSQIIAGERLNRRVFAIEIEPVFCDVAVKRWEEFTGKKAVMSKR